MTYRITFEKDLLRAVLVGRESAEEMRAFLRAVAEQSRRCSRILIQERVSQPIFQVERAGLLEHLQPLARDAQHRIALLSDTSSLQAAHEYLELIARQRGINVRSFRSELEALIWLRERRADADRRGAGDRRRSARSASPERRQNRRREPRTPPAV